MIKNRKYSGKAPKQLDAITQYLSDIASKEHIKAKPIWLPPIREDILLQEVEDKYFTTEEKYNIKDHGEKYKLYVDGKEIPCYYY